MNISESTDIHTEFERWIISIKLLNRIKQTSERIKRSDSLYDFNWVPYEKIEAHTTLLMTFTIVPKLFTIVNHRPCVWNICFLRTVCNDSKRFGFKESCTPRFFFLFFRKTANWNAIISVICNEHFHSKRLLWLIKTVFAFDWSGHLQLFCAVKICILQKLNLFFHFVQPPWEIHLYNRVYDARPSDNSFSIEFYSRKKWLCMSRWYSLTICAYKFRGK